MARVIQDNLKKPLANELLFGSLVDGGRSPWRWIEKKYADLRLPECAEAQTGSGALRRYLQ
jgi:hypothetical protein